jgi:hypothetical protein
MDNDKCSKSTCLDCKELEDESCKLLRAEYERKKASIQLGRYEQDLASAQQVETGRLTLNQLEQIILPHNEDYTDSGVINVLLMQTVLRNKLGHRIGRNKSYELASHLRYKYPEAFYGY